MNELGILRAGVRVRVKVWVLTMELVSDDDGALESVGNGNTENGPHPLRLVITLRLSWALRFGPYIFGLKLSIFGLLGPNIQAEDFLLSRIVEANNKL